MMMAMNMPYRATLKADTMERGSMSPAMMPDAVPALHKVVEISMAPKV